MGVLDNLLQGVFSKPPAIATVAELMQFMDSRVSFLAQKGVVEFCRVRAGVHWEKLFGEAEFQQELTRSRWQAYPPAFAMIAEVIEGVLREPAGIRQRQLPAVIATLSKDIFRKYPVPEGLAPGFWDEALKLVREKLDQAQGGPPRPVREIPKKTARLIFDALPLHEDVVTNDYDYIFNFLRMNLLRIHEDFTRAADLPLLVEDLLGKTTE
ncbi:hypothetical protein L598_001800000390 [Mesorhizobium sp. J18]|uniref:hypothetical protein n=1 Tax=Mesorhizobium sp. J18 TaxID=935263 RepID=UPI0011994375|nr:hypothetical protein [Mesorhizobium sp. J18]TWG98453.1 hypothetical protein L598_001800000390 [Mesorhizobium sp. J18]